MRFVCESCRAQYMINDEKVGPKGVKVRCRKCGYVIHVKRTDSVIAKAPAMTNSDADDGMQTQVMTSPLAAGRPGGDGLEDTNGSTDDPRTMRLEPNDPSALAALEANAKKRNGSPKAASGGDTSFLGADEDEIGAVFDSVLAGGATASTNVPGPPTDEQQSLALGDGEGDGDRDSTKVLDAAMVRKLASDSSAGGAPVPPPPSPHKDDDEVPQQDWYVALNEKQTGPMPLEQLKEHWDKGAIGPDSLCWRAGFSDWVPVSEVKILASVLAPKPAKPIVVAPATTVSAGIIAPAVVSVPVQSAFSAGGVMTTVQSEVQVPIGGGSIPSASMAVQEDTGTWRPSAASALASLVKEEMDVLAKPAPKKMDPEPMPPGLLDLPQSEEKSAPSIPVRAPEPIAARAPAPAPVNPYLANAGATYSSPAISQYRPPSNRGLLIGLGVGGGMVFLALLGLVLFLALREPKVVVAAPPAPVSPPTPVAAVQPSPGQPQAAPVVQPAPGTAPTQPGQPGLPNTAPAVASAEPSGAAKSGKTPKAGSAKSESTKSESTKSESIKSESARSESARSEGKSEAPKKEEPSARASPGSSGDDDFERVFAGSSSKSKASDDSKSDSPTPSKKKEVYIPPAPGSAGGDSKESLETSDIFETVRANSGALQGCAAEQRKREPGVTGRLVVKWTIQTSGKVSSVSVVSEEFKSTYMATCVSNVIKGISFPRHKKQGEPVQFPFKF
jgi:predicted Zn finger-like uncharacterized protein